MKRGDVGGSAGSGDTDARGCLIRLPCMHARFSFPHSFSISFSSSLRNDGSNSPLFPPVSISFSSSTPFFFYHALPLTTCSLRLEAIHLTSFSLAILLFSLPPSSFFSLADFYICACVFTLCRDGCDVRCTRGGGDVFQPPTASQDYSISESLFE